MAEPFKNLLNESSVRNMATHLKRVWPQFNTRSFTRLAATGLDELEFKARAMQIASALESVLPADFATSAAVLEAALGGAVPIDEQGEPVNVASHEAEDGLAGWVVWPMGEFVARRGVEDVPRALDCLHALTQRFSAEFAIRPFIDRTPDVVFPILESWTEDPSVHVRRLVSEGSRPKLPWGMRLNALVADPSPSLPLLRTLQDDASSYVRRSVANHLNDIAKDHPGLVADWVKCHLEGAAPTRIALLRHASRHLVKQGHAPTLAAWSLDSAFNGTVSLKLSTRTACIGTSIGLAAKLRSTSSEPQALVIDYVVHHRKANGGTSPKVFKGWKLTLEPGETRPLEKQHSLKIVTTRTFYPGEHRIELQINGQVMAAAGFELLPAG